MELLIKENIERQLKEMWDSIIEIPYSDPHRDHAINEANRIQRDLLDKYRKQEQLRNSASELLGSLEVALYELKNWRDHNVSIMDSFHGDDRKIQINICRELTKKIEDTENLIKKATE